MKTTVEKLDPTRVKLNIVIEPAEFKSALDEAYKHVARDISSPGFRKGKVPPLVIDSHVGRGYVMDHAVNDHLDEYYQKALSEHELRPLGRPEAEVVELPDPATLEGDLVVNVEVDVRPEIVIPELSEITVEVDNAAVEDADLDAEIDRLRSSFGTLITVDRPASDGDFTSIDMEAKIGDEVIDNASNISYEIGSGQLLEGIDEALDTLTAGETTTFTSKLVGGDHAGEDAEITVTLNAVKERQLPEADDDFAQMASEFDTIAELRESLKDEVAKRKKYDQLAQAREKVGEILVEKTDVPVPARVIEAEVTRHLNQEGKEADDPHADEVRLDAEKTLKQQMLFDVIGEAHEIKVSQDEITSYLIQSAYQYGVEPNQFIKMITESRQVPAVIAEVGRSKVLDFVLRTVKVVDADGNAVDFTDVISPADAGATPPADEDDDA